MHFEAIEWPARGKTRLIGGATGALRDRSFFGMAKLAMGEMKDVCVIGTGAGGGVWIDACTRVGLEVVALERGPMLGPADFARHDELSNIHRGVGFAPDWRDTARESDDEEAKPGRAVLLAQCVGGGTAHWGSGS